jgi:tRNA pseudouridine38-40 synthase
MRLKLSLAYDGTPFCGWQSQAGGNTIQDRVQAAFRSVGGTNVIVHGAGRTDAGVHALSQCAHVDVGEGSLTPRDWLRAVNANLPPEIRIMRCVKAAADFHARFQATGKRYDYRLWCAPVHPPLECRRSWHVVRPIDLRVLKRDAKKLVGTHDFRGFSANRGHPVRDTVRQLSRVEVRRDGPRLTLRFEGNGFLYKMVRLLTGTLIQIAQGRADESLLDDALVGKAKTSFAAPACGLYLVRVDY